MSKPKGDGLDELIASFPSVESFLSENIGKLAPELAASPLPTGSMSLDIMTGGGVTGFVEVFGSESSGKTALVAMMMAHCQRTGVPVALVPTEWLDLPYLKTLGVDGASLPILRRENEMVDFLTEFPRALIVIDSITGYRPKLEIPGEWTRHVWGLLERLSEAMNSGSSVVMVSQVRKMKIRGRVQSPIESASRRLSDWFDFRFFLSRTDRPEDAYDVRISAVANAGAPPATFVDLPGVKGQGLLPEVDLIRVAASLGVVVRKEGGSWYEYQGMRLGQGEMNAYRTVILDPELQMAITRDVLCRVTR